MRIFLILAVLAGAAIAIGNATLAPRPALGPGTVVHMHEQFFRALDAGQGGAAVAFLHGDMNMDDRWRQRPCQVFFTNAAGKTRRAMNNSESRELLAEMAREGAESGGSVKTTVKPLSTDCFSAELSYAVLEVERVHERGGQTWTETFVSTSLVTYADNGWKLTHWHLTPAGDLPGATMAKKVSQRGAPGER